MSSSGLTPLTTPSSYLDFLPAVFREGEANGQANFVGRFLKISEKLLSGIDDGVELPVRAADGSLRFGRVTGIEEILEEIHDYFDPLFTAPTGDAAGFLSYLARWVALVTDQNWDDKATRRLLTRIVPLYKRRGTKEGLTEYLRIFVGDNVSIDDFPQGIVIGSTSTVGVDTFVGGLLPYFFIVTINFSSINTLGFVRETIKSTKAIVDLEKPAHTYYALRFVFPGIIVGERSTVARDSIIGSSVPVFV
jgi:phage tail-like protein